MIAPQIYCDGACSGNPGKGGWAFIVIQDNIIIDFNADYYESTTNNRMELIALREAINWIIKYDAVDTVIYSDSVYVVNIFNDWVYRWAANNWTRGKGHTIKNLDLIQELYDLIMDYNLVNYKIQKVPGHTGVFGNELADGLASGNYKKLEKTVHENKSNGDFLEAAYKMLIKFSADFLLK